LKEFQERNSFDAVFRHRHEGKKFRTPVKQPQSQTEELVKPGRMVGHIKPAALIPDEFLVQTDFFYFSSGARNPEKKDDSKNRQYAGKYVSDSSKPTSEHFHFYHLLSRILYLNSQIWLII